MKIPRKLSLQSPLHPRDSFAAFFRVSFSFFLFFFLWTRHPNKINRIHGRFRAVDDRDEIETSSQFVKILLSRYLSKGNVQLSYNRVGYALVLPNKTVLTIT